MPIQHICLDWGSDALSVPYAAELARQLSATLNVVYEAPPGEQLDRKTANEIAHRLSLELLKTTPAVCHNLMVSTTQNKVEAWEKLDAVIVSNYNAVRTTLPLWKPMHEQSVRTVDAPVFIPLGNDSMFQVGFTWGIALAKQLKRSVVFYHTTWRKPGVLSDDPRKHWHQEAEVLMGLAEKEAMRLDVPYQTIVETAPSVIEGIHLAALRVCASCIVLQEDSEIIAGSHATHLRARPSMVPLVVLPEREVV